MTPTTLDIMSLSITIVTSVLKSRYNGEVPLFYFTWYKVNLRHFQVVEFEFFQKFR